MGKTIVVVGAGIIGASLAWHLARSGASVTVVDAGEPGGLATRNSFAWINASWGNPEFYVHFRMRAMRAWRRLAADVPAIGADFCGGLLWDLPPDELEAYAAEHARWGYGVRRVGRTEALRIEPGLKAPPEFALHVADEAMVEPAVAARILLANAGIAVRSANVAGLVERNGRVTGVATDHGEIAADEVVLAAGVEVADLLATVGVAMALDAPAGLIAHSTPADARLLNGLVLSPQAHVRQTAEGRLIAGSDFAGADPEGRGLEMGGELTAIVHGMIRGSENLQLAFFTVGHRPKPADGLPAIGRPHTLEGLYVAVMHSGITLAPLVGLLAAEEILAGRRDPMLSPYDPDRAALLVS